MSEADTNEAILDEEGLPIEGSNEPEEPAPLIVPPDCPDCPGGSPPWMATFADMATLLMAFFVLILSFANVNVPKFEQVSGSLAVAFGVERIIPKIQIPVGETLLSTEFTPADAEASVIPNKSQRTEDTSRKFVKQMTEENDARSSVEEEFQRVVELLADEIDQGQVSVKTEGEAIVVDLLSPENAASSGSQGPKLSGKISQEVLEIAQKVTQVKAEISAPLIVQRPIEGDQKAEGNASETDDRLRFIRSALQSEIAQGLAEVERDGDKILIRLGQQDSFDSGSATLKNSFQPTLQRVGSAIQTVGGIIRVEGHTDNVPVGFSDRYRSNWDLSSARSASVANYLVDNTALEAGRISVSGFADSKPIATNDTAEGRARNRRIEVIVDG
jgi:chemotaxis protein MotB